MVVVTVWAGPGLQLGCRQETLCEGVKSDRRNYFALAQFYVCGQIKHFGVSLTIVNDRSKDLIGRNVSQGRKCDSLQYVKFIGSGM